MAGEPDVTSNPFINIDCTSLNVIDDDGVPSGIILDHAVQFRLSTDWVLGGTFAPFIVGLAVPYTITYYAEQLGGPNDSALAVVATSTIAGQLSYGAAETTATIPANTLVPGTYKLTTVISFGGAPPMTAFFEGQVVQVF
jgi:hypothetical protein